MGSESLALPYHFLLRLQLVKGAAIVITYEDMKVTIEGTSLHPLWKELQLFNVREIRASAGPGAQTLADSGETASCTVTAIRMVRSKDAEEP